MVDRQINPVCLLIDHTNGPFEAKLYSWVSRSGRSEKGIPGPRHCEGSA